jgi:hypothetical protein
MSHDTALREQLIQLIQGGHAHATFDHAIRKFPLAKCGIRPPGSPHSAWELLEHLRIAQYDILCFTRQADWVSPKWPEGYWPESPAPPNEKDWTESVRAFRNDRAEFEALVNDPEQDLYGKIPWGDGQTLLREALLLADHNAYHLGQLVLVRKLLGEWE